MDPRYSIWNVSPPGYPHSRCFEEVALGLSAAFRALGFDAPVVTDPSMVRGTAIVLGPQLLRRLDTPLPEKLILYNLEQVYDGSEVMVPAYYDLLRRYPVWDYSARNVEALKAQGISAALCGIGYVPELTRIARVKEDIDVLFIGSMTPRRTEIVDGLIARGVNAYTGFNLYGGARDAAIARAKIMLNVHLHDAHVFEIVRVSYLLANGKCVVSETGPDEALEAPLRDGVAFAPHGELIERCVELLAAPEERQRLAQTGQAAFARMSQVEMLKRALSA